RSLCLRSPLEKGRFSDLLTVALTVLAAVLAVGYGAMVGGFRDADVNDEGVQNALHFAVVQHNRGSNNMYLSQVAEVIKVQSQVRKPSKLCGFRKKKRNRTKNTSLLQIG
uniref:Cystatin domain-containing protein n=1 Tax=Oreochromis niloticus TaxID=8128 RepID=A0A669DBJ0_ORENI